MNDARADRKQDKRSASTHGLRARPWWPWAKRILNLAFFALVVYLLTRMARTVEWSEVFSAMRERPIGGLLGAAAFAAASYAVYSCFDLFGRHYTGHGLRTREVIVVNFISYAFNLNLGSLIGGVAFRYRLYSRHGLEAETITRVVVVSMLTNWLGYTLLAGLVFLWRPLALPPSWKLDAAALQVLGAVLIGVALSYLLLCALAKRRTRTIRGHELSLPSLRFALLQVAISSLNWLLMACAVYLLLQQKIEFPTVLSVLLVAAIAGVITHVPAGLGVLEAVFVALLSQRLAPSELLASLLAYRAIYYLVPLLIATAVYLLVELKAKASERRSQ
jgi:glycosyltransferase 2 family protein